MLLLIVTIWIISLGINDALYCASCTNITSPHDCQKTAQCTAREQCYTNSHVNGAQVTFDLGCKPASECSGLVSSSFVGRAVLPVCLQCCTIDVCNTNLCSTSLNSNEDGGWSVWNQWSTCSKGQRTRVRVCNNPRPSLFGKDCFGIGTERDKCHPVAFTVTNPNQSLIKGRPIFRHIVTNVGSGYDPTSAIFTCPLDGLYQFSLTLRSDGKDNVLCFLRKNGGVVTIVETLSDSPRTASSTIVYLQLMAGDTVTVADCNNWDHVMTDQSSSFSGALIEQ